MTQLMHCDLGRLSAHLLLFVSMSLCAAADENHQHKTVVSDVSFVCGTELVPSKPKDHYQERHFLRVYQGKKLVLERHDAHYWVIGMQHPFEEDAPWRQSQVKPRLLDFTGDKIPEVVVQRWTGGVHGCYSYQVFRVAPKFEKIWQMDAQYGHLDFEEKPGQLPVLIIEDTTFAYWNCGYADSPRLKVLYQWKNGTFQLVASRMQGPADLARRAREISELLDAQGAVVRDKSAPVSDRWPQSQIFIPHLLELIYSGHADLAWKLLKESWPQQIAAERSAFQRDFLHQLKKSPHWPGLKNLNPKGAL